MERAPGAATAAACSGIGRIPLPPRCAARRRIDASVYRSELGGSGRNLLSEVVLCFVRSSSSPLVAYGTPQEEVEDFPPSGDKLPWTGVMSQQKNQVSQGSGIRFPHSCSVSG